MPPKNSPRLAALLLVLCACSAHSQENRKVDFCEGWRFAKGDHPGAEAPKWDDSGWRALRLPHDWGVEGGFAKDAPAGGDGGFLPTGVGWYRKQFDTPAEGRHIVLQCDGVMAHSQVWLNGRLLGRRPSGYVTFRYDLTGKLHPAGGEPNVLAIRADTSLQPASRWYAGSGVYRKVWLLTLDHVHVEPNTVAITTPAVSAEEATVRRTLTVSNQEASPVEVTVASTLIGPGGRSVEVGEAQAEVAAEGRQSIDLQFSVAAPRLWSVGDGQLYRLVDRVLVNGTERDRVETPFGIRHAEFRADSGFWLNGRNLKLKGVCLHHCAGALGAAVPKSVWRRRLVQLQSLGVNAIRTSHNPVAPEFLDLCDELGVLVMDEFFDCWTMAKRRHDYHKDFAEWSLRDLTDTVNRDRNHPSVILYSVGNEIRDTHKPELAKRVLAGLVDATHAADPTRPVTQGIFRPNVTGDYHNGLVDLLDVVGTNYRDQELLDAWAEKPSRKIVNTEQGHDRRAWLLCRDNAQHSGQFLWVGIDYLGESRRWPVTTFDTGLLDRTGHPHPRGYERQSWWSDQPMVHAFRRVAATAPTPEDPGYEIEEWKRPRVLFDDWTPREGGPSTQLVEVCSNCQEVELLHNGKSLGIQPLPADARPRVWRVEFAPGSLVAIGRNEGQEAARHALQTHGPAAQVALSAPDSLRLDWDDVAIVEARLVDAQGTPVARGARPIEFQLDGPGEIVGVDNGSITSLEPFRGTAQQASRSTHYGRCIAYVRATGKGKIRVTAESAGLKRSELTITAGAEQ